MALNCMKASFEPRPREVRWPNAALALRAWVTSRPTSTALLMSSGEPLRIPLLVMETLPCTMRSAKARTKESFDGHASSVISEENLNSDDVISKHLTFNHVTNWSQPSAGSWSSWLLSLLLHLRLHEWSSHSAGTPVETLKYA